MKKENDCFETKSLARQTYRVNINKICVNKYKKKKNLGKKKRICTFIQSVFITWGFGQSGF